MNTIFRNFFIFFLFVSATSVAQVDDLKESIKRGNEIYTDFCISCHLPKGEGVKGTFPPLAKSDFLMKNREASIRGIKYGLKGSIIVNEVAYNEFMAPMGLSNDEIADVVNYISNSWGNSNKSIVTIEQVEKIKKEPSK